LASRIRASTGTHVQQRPHLPTEETMPLARRATLCLGVFATSLADAAIGKSMLAFVQESADPASQDVRNDVSVPRLGDLRARFTALPHSCEVLVEVKSSSVNPADRSGPGPFPQVLGSDIVGNVVAAETSCQRLHVGDRVWADIGAVTYIGSNKSKEMGAYAQVAVALETQLGLAPPSLSDIEAGSLPKVALTSYKALHWYGGAPYGKNLTVLVLGGSGGTGTTGIQIAKAFGARTVITTTSATNMDYCKDLGADQVIDYHTGNWWEVLTPGSVHVIYDTVGQSGTADHAMQILGPNGFFVTIAGKLSQNPRPDVKQSHFINSDTNLDNVQLLDALSLLAEQKMLRMPRIKTYRLREVAAAFAESAEGHVVGKLALSVPNFGEKSIELRI